MISIKWPSVSLLYDKENRAIYIRPPEGVLLSDQITKALLEHNRPVPRYTSYPTAPHFTEQVTAEVAAMWLSETEPDKPLSLYFHIPFCKTLCWYCGCNTKATLKYEPVRHYLTYLKKEVSLVAARMPGKRPVSHIHFGGGSPSYIQPDDFTDFMDHVRANFAVLTDAEIAVEIDPRELTEPKVVAYHAAGVSRASLGVQDFHEDVQTAINRIQPLADVYDGVKLLRSNGITQINMDLLYGLPHQTVQTVASNIDIAAGLGPQRISLFGYAHVPWMKKHMRLIASEELPTSKDRLSQFEIARSTLFHKGYIQVGLDHFVRPDDPMAMALEQHTLKRNFQGYSTDDAPILVGMGSSAISALEQGYVQNTANTKDYYAALDKGTLPVVKGVALTDDDRLRRGLIEELMCYMQIDLADFCARHQVDPAIFAPELERLGALEQAGLVKIENMAISTLPGAAQAIRLICATFDPYLHSEKGKHSQVA